MSSEIAISLGNVSKYFEIYQKPRHRLWQIFLKGHKKFYREYWALADINLEIQQGECLGIVGRNGAGKSTLLQLMAGTLQPSSGSIAVHGRLAALLELGSGFNPEFTGKENVYLNAAILGLSPREIAARFDRIAEFADIGEFLEQPVKTYSSGMALRLAFAVIANVNADILIIDEALAVGDAFFTQKCMRFLRNFMQDHTVILVSHDTNAICSLCNRAILLADGRITDTGSPKAITQKYLEQLYADHQETMNLEYAAPAIISSSQPLAEIVQYTDMRQCFLNQSNLRNDLEIFSFNLTQQGFGTGKATIQQTQLTDPHGIPCNWVVGGKIVRLFISCRIHEPIINPIVGFMVLDKTGQELFGDNTWLTHGAQSLDLKKDDLLETVFTFQMPILAAGDYHITVALGEGTPAEHIQHHWIHEAITFTAHSSPLATGIVGVPMLDISMKRKESG